MLTAAIIVLNLSKIIYMKKTLTIFLLAIALSGLAQTKSNLKSKHTDAKVVTKDLIKENGEYRLYYANKSKDTLFLYNDGLGKTIAEVWDIDTSKTARSYKRPTIVFYKEPRTNMPMTGLGQGLKN